MSALQANANGPNPWGWYCGDLGGDDRAQVRKGVGGMATLGTEHGTGGVSARGEEWSVGEEAQGGE